MEIVYCNKGYDNSINFIDKDDTFVGFDLSQCCCEQFGWYIIDKEDCNYDKYCPESTEYNPYNETQLKRFIFDRNYIKIQPDTAEGGGYVVFCLYSPREHKHLFLHLFNMHNGYYAHNFEFKYKDKHIINHYL